MSKITEEARLLCNGTRYKIEFDLGDQNDEQQVILRRGDLARIEKIAGLVPKLVNEVDRWQQIAIREQSKNLALDELCPEGCCLVNKKEIDEFLEVADRITEKATEKLDAEYNNVIIVKSEDLETLKTLLKYIHRDLAENRHFDDGLEDCAKMLRRWQKQLGGRQC